MRNVGCAPRTNVGCAPRTKAGYAPRSGVVAIALLACLALTPGAFAHPLAPSLLRIEESAPGRARVTWKTPLLRVSGSDLRPLLPERCRALEPPHGGEDGAAWIESWNVDCGDQGLVGAEIRIDGIPESKTDVLVRAVLADGRTFNSLLTAAQPTFVVPARERRLDVLRNYGVLGIDHILRGFDHLLFVLGLVLLVHGRRRLLWTVTAFTLGHSVTLSLAALGFVHFPTRPIEALIALSILVVAVELTREAEGERHTLIRTHPWAIAGSFGLLHGLGFAGALAEVGLPQVAIPLALLSFNLGIEVGQVVFVLAVLAVRPIVAAVVTWSPWPVGWVPAYAIGTLAAFWFFERLAAMI